MTFIPDNIPNNQVRYWLMTTEYPPFHGGGISTYCYFTARMLAEKGFQVTVITQDETVTDYITTEEQPGISLVRFHPDRNKVDSFLGYTAKLSYAFADIIRILIEKTGSPDYIETQDYLGIGYYLTQYKHLGYPFAKDLRIIMTLHSPAFIYLEYNRTPTYCFPDFWTCEMEKHSMAAADLLISPTRFLVDEIRKHMDLKERKPAILANPYRQPIAGNGPVPNFTRNKIIYYGKLSPQKGSFRLLEYFKQLWDDGFTHPLHIIGGTDIIFHPQRQTMGQIVKGKYQHYISRGLLLLHGKIAPSQLHENLRDAHVIIVPSIVDNLPYVVMESMSMGKIVLASRQGGQREMIDHEVSGYLFDHDEPGSFQKELFRILALSDDRIREIGEKAVQSVQDNFGYEKILPEKVNLLKTLTPLRSDMFPYLHQETIPILPGSGFGPGFGPASSERSRPADTSGGSRKKGLLSVVIPYYNMERYIDECLQSILSSSYSPIEIIVLDDGSDKPYQSPDTNTIKVIRQTNQGLASARNAGSRSSTGEWLAFLDADDKVHKDYYAKAITALEKNINSFFAGCWVQYFENSTAVWPTFTPQPPYALAHNPVNSSALVYKAEAFLAGGLNDKDTDYGLEDFESVINMMHHGFNGVVLPEVLFYYRVRTGSMIRTINREKLLYSNKYIVDKHADYYAKFASRIIHLLNANGPSYEFDNPSIPTNTFFKSKRLARIASKLRQKASRNPALKKAILKVLRFINK